jgi:hypothetical protein
LLGHGDLLVTQRYRAFYLLLSLPTYAQCPPRQRLSAQTTASSLERVRG